jgi:hypothetical protein
MRISTYGPEAADLLRQRLAVLGRSGRDAAALGNGVWQDMQRACCECSEKDRCGRDLEIQPDDTAWRRYCPNADALQTIARGRPA